MKMMCYVCWGSLTPTNVSDVIVIEKGEVNDRWGAGKKRQENLPQSKALKSPTDKDCPYQASVAGGGKEALVRSQGEPVQGRLPGSMIPWNPPPVPDQCWAGCHLPVGLQLVCSRFTPQVYQFCSGFCEYCDTNFVIDLFVRDHSCIDHKSHIRQKHHLLSGFRFLVFSLNCWSDIRTYHWSILKWSLN